MNTPTPEHHPHRGLATLARRQTRGEEIANALSHGAGFVAALAGTPLLITTAARQQNPATITGACVFAVAMIATYFCSTLYHALPDGRGKRRFRLLDHAAIFLLIAGSYTPFTLGVLKGAWGWSIFGTVWALAVIGIVMKFTGGIRHPVISTGLYLVMGWLVLVVVHPLWLRMPLSGFIWLVAGGVAYTLGVPLFATDHKLKYGHLVWHVFVLTGTVCHFVAVYQCV